MSKTEDFLAAHPDLAPRIPGHGPLGWDDLVADTLQKMAALRDESGFVISVAQIKEKFGGLRLYASIQDGSPADGVSVRETPMSIRVESGLGSGDASKRLREIINAAEARAGVTCQRCGASGAVREGGWLVVLCDAHAKGRE